MATETLTWPLVDEIAGNLGAGEEARRKWRSRRVPHDWRIRIVEVLADRDVAVRFADFDNLLNDRQSNEGIAA